MKSAIVFTPGAWRQNAFERFAVSQFICWAHELAQEAGVRTEVTMQHNLKTDEFALLVELGTKKFYSHGPRARTVFTLVTHQMKLYLAEIRLASKQTEKQPAGKKSRRGHRRKSPARKRSS